MTNELALLAHWSVRHKLNRVSSVQFSYAALYAPLKTYHFRPHLIVTHDCMWLSNPSALLKSLRHTGAVFKAKLLLSLLLVVAVLW